MVIVGLLVGLAARAVVCKAVFMKGPPLRPTIFSAPWRAVNFGSFPAFDFVKPFDRLAPNAALDQLAVGTPSQSGVSTFFLISFREPRVVFVLLLCVLILRIVDPGVVIALATHLHFFFVRRRDRESAPAPTPS